MKTILITFQSEEDAKSFLAYKEKADKQEGTVSGLYCGIMCSALKRAKVNQIKGNIAGIITNGQITGIVVNSHK